MNERLWMTRDEAAEALGVGTRQIIRYMHEERLEWERDKISGRVRISRASVLEMKRSRGRGTHRWPR